MTNHHDLVQLPSGNFLLTSMRTVAPLTPEAATCRRQTATATFPEVTSDFVLRAFVQEVDPAGNLVREWDSAGDIALAETTVPICFQVPAGTGDDYLSSVHPNAIDLDLNGPGTGDDQLLVSGRHNDAVYGINFDAGTVDWKLGGTTTPQSLAIVGDPLGGPKRQHDVRILPNGHITLFDNRTQFTAASPPFATTSGPARYVEYAIDEAAGTATLVREIRRPDGSFSGATGSARLQADGGSSSTGARSPARCSPSTTRPTCRSSRSTCRVSTRATAR